jgi:hypothetical protein
MANQFEDVDSKCPLCFCELEEQPDGITEGIPNIIITGCCHKRLHSLCWDKSPKVKTWTEDNAFEKIRHKLLPDQLYKAKKCPFCRTLSDVQKIESKSRNSSSNLDLTDAPLIIGLTSTTSALPMPMTHLSQSESEVANQLINMVLGQITGSSSEEDSFNRESIASYPSQSTRARHRIHPYSNRERY